MTLWWLQPGWTDATCGQCGSTIYPEGDPDWGLCWPCMQRQTEQREYERALEERYRLGNAGDGASLQGATAAMTDPASIAVADVLRQNIEMSLHQGWLTYTLGVNEMRTVLAALTRTEPSERERKLCELLNDLQRREAEYRLAHDTQGDGSTEAGRAWDYLRRAGDKARDFLSPEGK